MLNKRRIKTLNGEKAGKKEERVAKKGVEKKKIMKNLKKETTFFSFYIAFFGKIWYNR